MSRERNITTFKLWSFPNDCDKYQNEATAQHPPTDCTPRTQNCTNGIEQFIKFRLVRKSSYSNAHHCMKRIHNTNPKRIDHRNINKANKHIYSSTGVCAQEHTTKSPDSGRGKERGAGVDFPLTYLQEKIPGWKEWKIQQSMTNL